MIILITTSFFEGLKKDIRVICSIAKKREKKRKKKRKRFVASFLEL
jgi:hypothetical protein